MNVPTTTQRAVHKDISPELMLRMRTEQGMTNKEIANQCGCSYGTVWAYIGAQGFRGGIKAPMKPLKPLPQELPAPVAVPPAPRERLLHERQRTVAGSVATYTIDVGNMSFAAQGETVEFALSRDDMQQFIRELLELEQMLPREAQ